MTKAIEAAATADQQRELLLEAFDALHPYPGPEHYLKGGIDEIDWTWDRLRQRFLAMLDAEAYESAALTLVPEGWRMAALCQRDPWFCRLETDDFESVTWGKGGDWITEVTSGNEATANAPTPALAIVIAALRAKGVLNE